MKNNIPTLEFDDLRKIAEDQNEDPKKIEKLIIAYDKLLLAFWNMSPNSNTITRGSKIES